MSDNIDIKVREDGSRVVSRNLKDIADQADKAEKSVKSLNTTLSGSQKSGTSLQWLKDNIQQVDSFSSSMVQRFGANLNVYKSALMKHFEMISNGARATSAEVQRHMTAMTTTPQGVAQLGDYYRAQEQAHNRFIATSAANMTRQSQLEQAEYSKRLSVASAAISAKQRADNDYTSWWARELDKRDALENKRNVEVAKNRLALATRNAGDSQKYWNSQASEAHALARGLSGSLGTLWMTYGSLLPLLAGAALGSAFVQAAKKGAEFAYQLEFVRVIGDETKESIKQLEDQALSLGTKGAFGPNEIASGYRGLAQAGLTAAEQLKVMPDVLNMATAGELSMEAASLSLVGVLNAFNLTVDQSGHVSDVFVKAAAVSQTSVTQMTESMKYASVVGDQYKVSLEDTATALAVLAKNNITGTAAGTSFRNMVKELYTPGREAAGVLKKLGVEASDANGKLKPFSTIIYELRNKLTQYDELSQVNILQKLFGERGAKEAVAMLAMTKEEWDKLQQSISNSDGFSKGVRDALGATAQQEWKAALNSLEAQFIRTFKNMEPEFVNIAQKVKDLFNSPEFASGVQSIVSGIATILSAAIDLAPLLVNLAKAWVTLRLATLAYSAAQAIVGTFTMINGAIKTAQMTMMTFAAVSAGTATTLAGGSGLAAAVGLIANPLGIILALLVAGAAAWTLWGRNAETASGKAIKTAQEKIKVLENENKYGTGDLGKERQELDRLQEIYDLRNRTRGLDIEHVNEARKAVEEQQKLVDLLEERENKFKNIAKIDVPKIEVPKTGLPSGNLKFNFGNGNGDGKSSGRLSKDETALATLQAKLKARQEEYDIMIKHDSIQFKLNEGASAAMKIEEELLALKSKSSSGLSDKAARQRSDQIASLEKQLVVAKQLDEIDQRSVKYRFSKEMEEEVRLAGMLSEERSIENEFLQKKNALASKSVLLSETEQEVLLKQLETIQEMTRLTSAKNSLLQNSVYQRRDFNTQVQAISELSKDPKSGFTQSDVASNSTSLMQGMGIDTSGTDAELQAKMALYQQYYQNLDSMRQNNLITEQDYTNAKVQLAIKENQLKTQNYTNFFSTLATLQSSNIRELAAIGKAAAITQAVINTYEGATKALAQGGIYGAVMAAAVVAAGMAQVAQIRSQGTGFMTGGSFTVGGSGGPDSQNVSFRATPGERVTVSTPTQVRKGESGVASGAGLEQKQIVVTPKIVNVLDRAIVGDYLATDEGEQLIMNVVQRNQRALGY